MNENHEWQLWNCRNDNPGRTSAMYAREWWRMSLDWFLWQRVKRETRYDD